MRKAKLGTFIFLVPALAVSFVKAQEHRNAKPKQYKVAEVEAHAVSPDGRFLSYTDWDTGNLAVLDLQTGDNRLLTKKVFWSESSEYTGSSTVSPNGKRVAYAWFNEDLFCDLRIVRLDGSEPRVLYRNEELQYIRLHAWSPDGKYILATFSRKDRTKQIVLVSVANGSVRVLKGLDWPFTRPPLKMSFSPDGGYIAFEFLSQEDSPTRDIFLLATDGSREIALVRHPANDLLLDWLPDGKRILFVSDRTGTWDAWVIQVADGEPRGLPTLVKPDIGLVMHRLGFTRDGSYYYGVSTWEADVYLATLDPVTYKLQGPKKLVHHVGFNTSVEWSPDGRYLAYAYGHGWEPDPFVLGIHSVDSGKERRLQLDKMTRWGGHSFWPHWSPDGRSFLAEGNHLKGRQGAYRIDAQTGEISPLVQSQTGCPDDCIEWGVWTPKGNVIFTRRIISSPRRVVSRDLKTGQEEELYREAPPVRVTRLAISPDGQWLAFVSRNEEKRTTALKVISTTGGEARELLRLNPPEFISAVAWMADGRQLLFGINHSPDHRFELWRISAEGGEPQHLGLGMEGVRVFSLSVHPDGRRIAFIAGTPVREEVWVLENFLPPLKTAN